MSRSMHAEQGESLPYNHHLHQFLTFLKHERGFADATIVNRERSRVSENTAELKPQLRCESHEVGRRHEAAQLDTRTGVVVGRSTQPPALSARTRRCTTKMETAARYRCGGSPT